MKSVIRIHVTLVALLLAAVPLHAQFPQLVDRNASLLGQLRGSLEGYSQAVSGQVITYPRLREDRPEALITRATTGTMAIEWLSQPVPVSLSGNPVSFVVSAGIMARPNTLFTFRLFINDTPAGTFTTVDTTSWEITDASGVQVVFDGVMRDQNSDAFGYMRILVPSRMLNSGEPVRFRAVGDSAGSRVWFMVFKESDVMPHLEQKVGNESYCDLTVEPRGTGNEARLSVPDAWKNKTFAYQVGDGRTHPIPAVFGPGNIFSSFPLEGSLSERFRLFADGETLIDIDRFSSTINESKLFSNRLVTLRSALSTAGGWSVQYRSFFTPRLAPSLEGLSATNTAGGAIDMIISTHQDIAWMDSPQQCIQDRDEKILTPTLAMMKEDSTYRFDLEDVLFLREYLERHPDRRGELQQFIAEGRLGIGASYNQPYEDLCSGEALVREFYAGRKWLHKNFPGTDARTYWNPDVPGRTAQMAQILRKAGVTSMFISRFEKGLFNWLSPDGSGVLTFSPGHYGDFFERVGRKGIPEMAGYIADFASSWGSIVQGGGQVVPIVSMSDMSTPVQYDNLMKTWNGLGSIFRADGSHEPLQLPPIHYSSASAFFDAVAANNLSLPTISGERPNIWLYIHGPTHERAITAKREADWLLPAAETFSTIDALLSKSFAHYPQYDLTNAWEAQIYPDHGWGGKNGEITDSTFRAKYEYARNSARRIYTRAISSIATKVRTPRNKGIPLVVFNNLSWKRTAPVQFTTSFRPGEFLNGFTVHDGAGRILRSQVIAASTYPDGSLRSATVAFIAEDVPPVGYETFYIRHSPSPLTPDTTNVGIGSLLNKYYRIFLSEGGVRQIFDVELQQDLLNTEKFLGGELFTMQSVGQDAGEWAKAQQPTMEGFDKLSNYQSMWRLVESGPVRQVAEMRQDIEHATVVQRIILYNVLKQIDFETSLLKWDGTEYREFRLAFPVNMQTGQVTYEVPFGTVEVGIDEMKGAAGERYQTPAAVLRPRSIQNWISVSDNTIGVTIGSSVAVWDYQDPTDQPQSSPMLQPVLLASRRSCHGLGPWYLQEGDHHYRFSLTSHRAGWRNGRRFGTAANNPLTAVFSPGADAKPSLPEQRSFFSVSAENIVLSTMKKCDDDDNVVFRLYEDSGKDVSARLRFVTPLTGAQTTNIIEEDGLSTPFKIDELKFDLGHWSIQTFKVAPKFMP